MKKYTGLKLVAGALVTGLLFGVVYLGGDYLYQQGKAFLEHRRLAAQEQEENPDPEDMWKDPAEDGETPYDKDLEPLGTKEKPTPLPTSKKDVSGVVDNVMPALVSVQCNYVTKVYDFFGRSYEQESNGSGSGILVGQGDSELLVVTNYHVIDSAVSVEVMFVDGKTAKAQVRASEASEDLAVLTVNLADLKKSTLQEIRLATLGDSDELKLGDMVIAIGNALGYGQSSTVGYVSALDREVKFDDGSALKLIQTDVAINPGNSGGALINAKGEVIGINNAKIASTKVEGICYAIPISHAVPVINELLSREELSEKDRAYVGIVGQDVTKANAEALNMPVGIYVKEVEEGSPAEAAGLHAGAIITKINGRSVTNKEEFLRILSYTRGGTEGVLTVQVMQDGEYVEEELPITFGFRGKGKN